MDAERSGQAMTDTAIDREIQAALSVEPSPEFLARVRTRIATEPASAASWLSWKLVATGAVAALVVMAFVVSRPEGKPPPLAQAPGAEDLRLAPPATIEQPGRTPVPFPGASGFPPPLLPSSAERRRGRAVARTLPVVSGFSRTEPEILLDPAETRALRRLISGTREGTLDLSASLQATTPTAMDLPPISEIAIPFITIDPLTPEAGEEGARQ
jgi:hypothetical protein